MDKSLLQRPEYSFLQDNRHLGKNIMLIGLGGSYAYGTNTKDSDIDIRGITYNSKREILLGQDFEQVDDSQTDTVIYSFRKMIKLLTDNNPNTIEILGLRPQDYLMIDDIGKELVANAHMFLSRRCVYTFGGYANSQLRRLQQRAMRSMPQTDIEQHMQKSIEHASVVFKQQVASYNDDAMHLFTDISDKPEYDTEMFIDINLKHYPLRDLHCLYQDVSAIIRDYDKIGKRNKNAYTHAKIAKHAMHLVRLYLMCIDILEKEEIRTYREEDHDLLMDIRNGKYLDENHEPTMEFFEIVDDLEKKMEEAKEKTKLPDHPDYEQIMRFTEKVNEKIVRQTK